MGREQRETRAADPRFRMPKPVKIAGRSSSITNSFVNAIIPVIRPTPDEISEALSVLGMSEHVECVYCGDPHTEWDHLRPLIINKVPTGYISEIHNLVPSCGKCNQSKGNKNWKVWMYSGAKRSPLSREVAELDAKAARLERYERWKTPTKLDFAEIVGRVEWELHELHLARILSLMKQADAHAATFRDRIHAAYAAQWENHDSF